MEDYYSILGIDRSYPFTDPSDLKKKYLKLSVKLHPDKNPNNPKANENFQKLTEAYNVLNDPKKRMAYNIGGSEKLREMNNMDDREQDEPKVVYCNITLSECYTGIKKNIDVVTKVLCNKCYGVGGKKETSIACKKCNASGIVNEEKEIIHPLFGKVMMKTRQECKSCLGKGITFTEKCDCNNGFNEKTEKIKFTVKKGALKFVKEYPEKGDENKSGQRGMLVIVQKLDDNTEFKIHGEYKHLILEKKINLIESLTGVNFSVNLPSGKTVNIIECDNVISPDSCHIVENAGMPIDDTNMFGDLIITYSIKYPKKLTDDDKQKLASLVLSKNKNKKKNSDFNITFTHKKFRNLIEHNKLRNKKRNLQENINSDTSDNDDDDDDENDGDSDDNFGNGENLRFHLGGGGINLGDLFSAFH